MQEKGGALKVEEGFLFGDYFVEAGSLAGAFYRVDVTAGACTCQAGQYNRYCKHLRAATARHDERRHEMAPAALTAVERPVGMAALHEAFGPA